MEQLLSRGVIPEPLIRIGIRQLLKRRISESSSDDVSVHQERINQLVAQLRKSPIAIETDKANTQHYELPSDFFRLFMGRYLKYSSGYWDPSTKTLDQAEQNMLELYIQRAKIQDNMRILDLGCGWGSFSLFAAQNYPHSEFTAISNSRIQKDFIESRIKALGLKNLEVLTMDANNLNLSTGFDRIISIEMFEHMRNYEALLCQLSDILNPGGKLFVHIFTHKNLSYLFEDKDSTDFLSRNFFSGGIMPSDHLLYYFNRDLRVQKHWVVNGQHYSKTSEAWLHNMKRNKSAVMKIFKSHYGSDAKKWWEFWKIFFMSCAELWGYEDGNQWHVSHYLFGKVNDPD
ncbi:SAM-dependent methyltransferase [Pseudobacteriovorax antillogorgiicola]|uniref:Cyclopropane-fatty-acyl-phospholipid synthase n=1 Tax=Pseudobacteriovorax antillogorgiicola TaxID=1513793 RepID=A0A1Y6C9X3_9BACT|nr:class I SAM-dependent methyltransferase [Pseudobacteriovorax antillogorgiicola]TCS48993.1 cyclopropane-fatty-acyl-phospholipid synthase [Pseudobacteriovorax antillogorgiicola]SMF53386.1 cyclopropane-fatty-acyl-phospholipid synthase [Pseudobacteriovorax antillogorgiicola]